MSALNEEVILFSASADANVVTTVERCDELLTVAATMNRRDTRVWEAVDALLDTRLDLVRKAS